MDWVEPTGWPEDARRDRLIGDWHIYQRRGGHRTSTDDLITAWYAVHRSVDAPRRYLDLGCGIGSVLLMTTHRLRPAFALGVEAQPQSHLMAARAIEELEAAALQGIELSARHGDFRSLQVEAPFDLITGSPPYFPLDSGVLPADSQRRACRFEARGGVEAYCEAAGQALTEDGRFYLVFPTMQDERVQAAASASALWLTGRADFHMRRDRDEPFLTVYELRRARSSELHRFEAAVRDERGEITAEYMQLRRELGVQSD